MTAPRNIVTAGLLKLRSSRVVAAPTYDGGLKLDLPDAAAVCGNAK